MTTSRTLFVAAVTALVLPLSGTAAFAGGGDARTTATGNCTSVTATSTKDLSNVVLAFEDGDHQKFEGLSGRRGTFAGTGSNTGEVITTVWVKSGANHSGDGPGYGERHDLDTSDCSSTPQDQTPSDEPAADGDGDAGSDASKESHGGSSTESGGKSSETSAPSTSDQDVEEGGADESSRSSSQGGSALTTADGSCASVAVSSTKDLSNVVLAFEDGDHQKFEGVSGRRGTFAGTGSNTGEVITTVWVKSGANHSGDGPGYGERHDLDVSDCTAARTGNDTGSDGTGGDDGCATTGGGECRGDDEDQSTDASCTAGDTTDDTCGGAETDTSADGTCATGTATADGCDRDGERSDDTRGDDEVGAQAVDRAGADAEGCDASGATGGGASDDCDDADQDTGSDGEDATSTFEGGDPDVLGVTLDRERSNGSSTVLAAGDTRSADDVLPNSGAALTTLAAAAMGAIALGTGLLRRRVG